MNAVAVRGQTMDWLVGWSRRVCVGFSTKCTGAGGRENVVGVHLGWKVR